MSSVFLDHVDGRVGVRHLPGEVMAPGCIVGRRQASGGSVMLSAMFCWETLGLTIHVDINLTCVAYLNINADQVRYTSSWQWYSLMAVVSFSRIIRLATLHTFFRNGLRQQDLLMFHKQ